MHRQETRPIYVGNIQIGGQNRCVLQSMTNVPAKNIEASIAQINELAENGCEIVRLATLDAEDARAIKEIKKHVAKEYYVECRDQLTEEAVKAFKSGMELKDGTVFAKAECTHIEDYSCHLVLHEGKYHEIKRMFLSVGNEVTYLKRIRMKNLILDETLKKGEYRLLTDEELNDLKKDEQE